MYKFVYVFYSGIDGDVLPDGAKRPSKLSFVMIREDIWNHVIETYKGEFWNQDSENDNTHFITTKEYYSKYFKNYLDDVNSTTHKYFELIKLFGESENKCRIINTKFYTDYIGNNQDNTDFYKQWSELMIVMSYLGSVRKGWMIQAGAGSQCAEWNEYKLLAEKIIEICNYNLSDNEEE